MRHKLGTWWNAIWKYPSDSISISAPSHDAYWESRGRKKVWLSPWQKARADIFLRCISSASPRVADVGCGDGAVLSYLNTKISDMQGIGLDDAPGALAHVREAGFETTLADVSKESVSLPEVDYTLLFEIIEHIPHAEVLVAEALRASSKGVCISVPNTGFFTYRLRMLFGKAPAQWVGHPSEHVRFWTVRDMKWWLQALSLTGKVYTYQGVPILNRILPGLFAAGMVVYIETNHDA